MVLMHTPETEMGSRPPDFCLKGVADTNWNLADCRGANGLLVMFICNHCPYVKAIREKLVRDCRHLLDYGIGSVAIQPNDAIRYPDDGMAEMRRIAETFDFPFPYLLDETQEVARAYGAVCTPDFFGYNADLELQYRGRLDAAGATQGSGHDRRELYEAMVAISETGDGPAEQHASMGCSIKWREG